MPRPRPVEAAKKAENGVSTMPPPTLRDVGEGPGTRVDDPHPSGVVLGGAWTAQHLPAPALARRREAPDDHGEPDLEGLGLGRRVRGRKTWFDSGC